MNNECLICAEKFNKSTRLEIKCQYCEFTSCRECCKKYLLNEYQPKCMNTQCNREWTRQFLAKNFTNSFLCNEYKKHKEEILYERERTLMPATQVYVENVIKKEAIKKELHELNLQYKEIQRKIQSLSHESAMLITSSDQNRWRHGGVAKEEKPAFVRKCPVNECNGFLSTQWKCGICQNWTCPDCHIVKGLERDCGHTCNQDDVNTAIMLSQNTRQCPKCNMGIFKLEGCDQMWCTACNTAFSWRTGNVINTAIHNPHYFEWQARNPQANQRGAQQPVGCQQIDHRFVANMMHTLNSIHNYHNVSNCPCNKSNCLEIRTWTKRQTPNASSVIIEIARQMIHIRDINIGTMQYDILRNNEKLRIAFMRNEINEEKFKTLIQMANKKHEKHREYMNVYTLVVDTVTDILIRFMAEITPNPTRWNGDLTILGELQNIREYANQCLADISATYKSCKYVLNDSFAINTEK